MRGFHKPTPKEIIIFIYEDIEIYFPLLRHDNSCIDKSSLSQWFFLFHPLFYLQCFKSFSTFYFIFVFSKQTEVNVAKLFFYLQSNLPFTFMFSSSYKYYLCSFYLACDEWNVLPKPNLHRDLNRFGHSAVVSNG